MTTLAPLTRELWGAAYDADSPYFFSRHSTAYHFYAGGDERQIGCHVGVGSLLTDASASPPVRVNSGGCSVMFEDKWLKPYGGDIHWLHALPISFKFERRGYDASAWRLYVPNLMELAVDDAQYAK